MAKVKFGASLKKQIDKPVKAKSRDQILDVYSNMEMKRDLKNDMNYAATESFFSSLYGGLDPRRRKEMADAGMVKEDRNAIANLPNEPIHQEYPATGFYYNPFIDNSTKE